MSKLIYDILLREEYDKEGEPYQERVMSEEHFKTVKGWLPSEFKACRVHEAFYGVLKDKVQSCTMNCFYRPEKDGGPVARVIINFVPGFRLTEERRQACWDQMDGQMSDGFGESYDRTEIPGGGGWRLQF